MAGAALSKLLTLCSVNPSGCMGSFVICTAYSEQKAGEIRRLLSYKV
jgi:hypothetical protein